MPDVTEDAKYPVIELLADNPDLTQREMAKLLGLTLGKTHYSLKALAKAGLIKAERFAESDRKMGYLYVLTPAGYHPEMILAGRRLNDGMGEYVVSQLVKRMVKEGIQVGGAKVLVMGLTFKENCPDLRNTKAVDIITERKDYNINADIVDPCCSPEEAMHEYGLQLTAEYQQDYYDAIILAVGHNEFKQMGATSIRKLGKASHVLYDLKYILAKNDVDMRL